MKAFLKQVLCLFFLLGFIFIPLNFDGKGFQYQITTFLFSPLISFFQKAFFRNALEIIDYSSDTIALNLLLLLLFGISFLMIFLLRIFKADGSRLMPISRFVANYYLFFILLKYGVDKIFKAQFYMPEPNILYSDFGNLPKDILYWSTMGTSHSYSVFTGLAEAISALLLVSKRTRVLGLLITLGIFVNIIFINIGFDISVKTFSAFLLLANAFLLYPFRKSLVDFFFLGKSSRLDKGEIAVFKKVYLNIPLTIMTCGILIIQVFYPYVSSGKFNGDKIPKPDLHGAYQVEEITIGSQSLAQEKFPLKRIFIHKNSYIILQTSDEKCIDYHFSESGDQLILEDYRQHKIGVNYKYNPKDSILKLHFEAEKEWRILAKKLNLSNLPALQDDFHLTIDAIR